VGEDHPSGAGAASVIAGLARRHVAAHAGALGARQRRLHDQQIGVPGDLDQLFARAAIGSVRESPAAVGGGEVDGVGGGEVRDLLEARPQGSDLDGVSRTVLLELEGALDQIVLAPGADHLAEALAGAGRGDQAGAGGAVGPRVPADRDRLLAGRIGQRVRIRDQVEEMVGVQVGDDHRVQFGVIAKQAELREDAVAAIEQ
jgi:hypothetical protein